MSRQRRSPPIVMGELVEGLAEFSAAHLAQVLNPPDPTTAASLSRGRFAVTQFTTAIVALATVFSLCVILLFKIDYFPQLLFGLLRNCSLSALMVGRDGSLECPTMTADNNDN